MRQFGYFWTMQANRAITFADCIMMLQPARITGDATGYLREVGGDEWADNGDTESPDSAAGHIAYRGKAENALRLC
jgi:hypothetical protein